MKKFTRDKYCGSISNMFSTNSWRRVWQYENARSYLRRLLLKVKLQFINWFSVEVTKLSDYSCIVRPHYKVLLQNTLQRWIFIHSAGIISKKMRPKKNTFSPVLYRTCDFTVQARSRPYTETFRIYKEHNHWQEAGFTEHSQFEPLSPQTPTLSSKIYIFVCNIKQQWNKYRSQKFQCMALYSWKRIEIRGKHNNGFQHVIDTFLWIIRGYYYGI